MSYQVLARKWRPRKFSELVGQEHVVRALTNALETGRTHHAYLFAGTRGVGKTTIARIFAKALNCEKGPSAEPCGECAVCQAIDAGRFVDLLEIDAASNTGVDDVREVIENAQYAPARGRYKVYLIDEVHMLSRNAFNALLKTLEEPPPHVKFLLATTDPQKLPATVLSRCLRFNLKRLLPEQITGQMRAILEAEGIEHDAEALAELARAADGSLRDGLSLLDQALAYAGGALHAAETRAMLGTVERSRLFGLLDALAAGDGKALLEECDHIASFAPDFASVLEELATLLHRVQLHQLVPDYRDERPDVDAVAKLAAMMGPEDVQLFYQLAVGGRRDLGFAPDARTGFEMTLLRMLAFQPQAASEGGRGTASAPAVARPGQARTGGRQAAASVAPVASAPSAPPAPAPRHAASHAPALASSAPEPHHRVAAPSPPPPRPAATTPDARVPSPAAPASAEPTPSAEWGALIKQAGLRGAVRQLALNTTLQSLQDGVLTLVLDPHHASLAVEPMSGQLQEKLAGALGHPVKLRFVHGEATIETPAAKARAARDERQAAAERCIDEDAVVQSFVRDFGAHVVPQSVRPYQPPTPESH